MDLAHELSLPPGTVEEAGRVRRLFAAVDGSTRSEEGLAMAVGLAEMIDADIEVGEVDTPGHHASLAAIEHLARRHGVSSIRTTTADTPADGLMSMLSDGEEALACLATHGRDRSAALVGSVAQSLLAQTDQPVLLAGPECHILAGQGGAVVAAVDGSGDDLTVVGTASGWARRLGLDLHLVTVVEPAPGGPDGAPPHRAHGPARPEEHLGALAAAARGRGVEASTAVLEDPVVVAPALVEESRRVVAALVVVGSRRRRPLRRVVLGDHAAQIVHAAPSLVLAAPLG